MKDLRSFIDQVKKLGPDYYAEVKRPVKPELEPFALQYKLLRAGRMPVIYCPRIEGSTLPLVTGVWGSYRLLAIALGLSPAEFGSTGIRGLLAAYRQQRENPIAPVTVDPGKAPVREVVVTGDDVDLDTLPITQHGLLDSGRYIAAGITICQDPATGTPNAGIYRMELKAKDRLGLMLIPHHDAAAHARRYRELGQPMEVVTCIGHHPMVGTGAVVATPRNSSEFEVMGGLLGEPVALVDGLTVSVPSLAGAEIAIEGVVDTEHTESDGPFTEALGYYGEKHRCYVVKVTAITRRQDAIYHDLDPSHQEHMLVGIMGRATNAFDKVSGLFPGATAVNFGPEKYLGKVIMYLSIQKASPGDGTAAGLAALAVERSARMVIVVDQDIDVFDEAEVLWAVATRVRPDRDILFVPRTPSSTLNPVGYTEPGDEAGVLDTRMLIDATRPTGTGFPERVIPPEALLNSISLEDYIK